MLVVDLTSAICMLHYLANLVVVFLLLPGSGVFCGLPFSTIVLSGEDV